jgi:hypothetical protein
MDTPSPYPGLAHPAPLTDPAAVNAASGAMTADTLGVYVASNGPAGGH